MEKYLSKVKTGGKFSLVIFGAYVAISLASGNGCEDLSDRVDVDFGVTDAGIKL